MRRRFVLLLALWLPWVVHAAEGQNPLTVYAAASLSEALQACADRFTVETGIPVRLSFAASSTLGRQIEGGATADIYISADSEWMDYLAARHLIQAASRHDLLANRLVLIADAKDPIALHISPGFPLPQALGADRLAVADPDSVPAGRYAHAALAALGLWDAMASHLARGENVRSVLQFVARGQARLGIVYETDAKADPRVRVVDVFPAGTHPPIRYPVAATHDASPRAPAFLGFLSSPTAAAIFAKYGFQRP